MKVADTHWIDAASNIIRLGRRVDLETRTFEVQEMRFVAGDQTGGAAPFRAEVQIRHRGRAVDATVKPSGDGRWGVETDTPLWAAAPGQAAVFYRGEAVVGGGRIARSEDPADA